MQGRSRPSKEGRHVGIRNATLTSQKRKNYAKTSFNFMFPYIYTFLPSISTPTCACEHV